MPIFAQDSGMLSKGEVDRLIKTAERKISDSRDMIIANDYARSKSESEGALRYLERLKIIFSPLDENIKQVLKLENKILENTRKAEFSRVKDVKKEVKSVIVQQKKNSGNLRLAIKKSLLSEKQKKKSLISSFLKKALEQQEDASVFLEQGKRSSAIQKQVQSIEFLKKALEQLKKESPKEKNNSSKKQPEKNKEDKSNSEKKEKEQNGTEKNKQDDASSKQTQSDKNKKDQDAQDGEQQRKQSKSTSDGQPTKGEKLPVGEGQKMDSKDALKELMRLQQKYDQQKKEREQKYGVIKRGRVEVERDW